MLHTYETAYAFHYPRYSALWARKERAACEGARADIYATIAAQGDARDAYAGKLYAELDAVRDRLTLLNAQTQGARK